MPRPCMQYYTHTFPCNTHAYTQGLSQQCWKWTNDLYWWLSWKLRPQPSLFFLILFFNIILFNFTVANWSWGLSSMMSQIQYDQGQLCDQRQLPGVWLWVWQDMHDTGLCTHCSAGPWALPMSQWLLNKEPTCSFHPQPTYHLIGSVCDMYPTPVQHILLITGGIFTLFVIGYF